MPIRLCLERRCLEPAVYRGRCLTHRTEWNRDTRSKNKQVYNSKRWRILRRKKLGLNPICEHCDNTLADHVHHIRDIQQGGDPWTMANLEALCHSCHSIETRARQQGVT
jgi:5-methylcytosine-specific restriction protein A